MINWWAWVHAVFPIGTQGGGGPLPRVARPYCRYLPLIALLGFFASLLESIGIGLLIPLLGLLLADPILEGLPRPIAGAFALTAGLAPGARISAIAGTMMALIVLKGLVQAGNTTLIGWVNGRIGRDVRTALASSIIDAEYSFFLRNDTARLIHIISTDSWYVSEAMLAKLAMLPAALAILVFSVFLAWLDWRLFLIVLAGSLLIRLILALLSRRLRRLGAEVTASNQALGERMMGIVNAMRVIRVFGQQDREKERFAGLSERMRRALLASQRLSASLVPAVDVMISLLFVAVLLAGYTFGISVPAIAAFLVLLSRAQPHARTISEGQMHVATLTASTREVEWLLEQPGARIGAAASHPDLRGAAVRFDRVSYAYPGAAATVSEASFELRPGVATALIGPSGSGKTTLVNLLCGLVQPQSGTVLVGGAALDADWAEAWRERIGIAGQDIELVDGTVAENIAYGARDATPEAIAEAARAAGAADFIALLPQAYETRVGGEGKRLSGGQRQRIGLARALLRRPELLILDEATNAVDAISENEFLRLLAEHRHFGTALVISHRRSTLAMCEDGVVIDRGRIVETGPLRDLAYFRTMPDEPPES